MYKPKVGDEVTFVNAMVNRDIVYTVAEVDEHWVRVTTPRGYRHQGEDLFSYSLERDVFDSLGPRTLEAAKGFTGRA